MSSAEQKGAAGPETQDQDVQPFRRRADSSSGLLDTSDANSYDVPPARLRPVSGAAASLHVHSRASSFPAGMLRPTISAPSNPASITPPRSPAVGAAATATSVLGSPSGEPILHLGPQASVEENPQPQQSSAPNPTSSGTNGDKMVIVMVGLPARGKTYVARKLAHYFRFFQGAPAEVFNVGNYRRQISGAAVKADFFDTSNEQGKRERQQAADAAMQATKAFMNAGNEQGRVAIYDATNTTRERRSWIMEQLRGIVHSTSHVVFVEIICTNDAVIESNIRAVKTSMPDYKGQTPDEAVADFRQRISKYLKVYEPMGDESLSWIKLIDEGRQVTANNIRGNLQSRVLQFILSLHNTPRPIYLSRHGQSEYNVLGKVGGDSDLSVAGEEYALKLAEFAVKHVCNPDSVDSEFHGRCNPRHARLWTSSLRRTINTARHIDHSTQPDGWVTMRPRVWRNLDEIFAGIFDGLTYEEIQARAPDEFEERKKNKLAYRYPRGESYLDVIARLDPLVHEIERQRDPVMVVGHQGILRIIYCYFMGIDRAEAPFHKIPLNTIIKLVPAAYGCNEERICLIPGDVAKKDQPSH